MRALLLTAALLAAGVAHADEFHFEAFRYGQRAMGMGGAVTGLAIEPGAAWYNPAGLARLKGAEFSGAITFVGLDRQTVRGGIRDEDFFKPRDVSTLSQAPTPTTGVASVSFGRHALALTSFLASDSKSSFSGQVNESFPELGDLDEVRFTLRSERTSRQLMRGLTYAYQWSDEWAFGVSAYWVAQDRVRRLRRGQFIKTTSTLANVFIDQTVEDKSSTHSGVIRVGALWTPAGAAWSAGAACTSPSLTAWGKATYSYTLATSGDPGSDDDEDLPAYVDEQVKVDARTVLPAHCRVGGAWQIGGWTLTADASLVLPIGYTRYETQDSREALYADEVTHELTVNGAVGVEVPVGARWPLRAGLFTNRTSAPAVPAQSNTFREAHVDRYGATVSLGYLGEKRSLNFGLEGQIGVGHDSVSASMDSLSGDGAFVRLNRDEWRVVFFVAGAAAFARQVGTALLKGDGGA